jgi:tetratricopeptide (TPR) repeat protein
MTKTIIVAVLLAAAPARAGAQDPAHLQKLFEAGQYQQVVESTPPEAAPEALYTAAQSHQKLGATEQALEIYRNLAARPEGDPWRLIGLSAQQLLEEQPDAAVESAQQAVAANGDLAEAHFQLGLAQAKRQAWPEAAAAFDRAAELKPGMAYAHYYGGLMHYRAKRPDRMANHFEQFLKLAPEAPERPEVIQIMRTVRGK